MDQEKYVPEQVHPVKVSWGRSASPEEFLTPQELRDYRGIVAQLQWTARQSRPGVSGSASLLASECPRVRVKHLLMANKVAIYLGCTAKVHLVIWPLDLSAVAI
eukprot:8178496-Pyramimonas_sp.AAC.1